MGQDQAEGVVARHGQSEGVAARADYGIPVCEWWVGGPPKLFLSSSSFFLSPFRTGDGLGFVRFCSWDVSEGGPRFLESTKSLPDQMLNVEMLKFVWGEC